MRASRVLVAVMVTSFAGAASAQTPPLVAPPMVAPPPILPPVPLAERALPPWLTVPATEAGPLDDEDESALYRAQDGGVYRIPQEILYDPRIGIPPGYRRVVRSRRRLQAAGLSVFLGLWVISAIVGLTGGDAANPGARLPMVAPIVGPWIGIATTGSSSAVSTLLVLDGVMQGVGLAAFIYGTASPQRVLRHPEVALRLAPLAAPVPGGAVVGLQGAL